MNSTTELQLYNSISEGSNLYDALVKLIMLFHDYKDETNFEEHSLFSLQFLYNFRSVYYISYGSDYNDVRYNSFARRYLILLVTGNVAYYSENLSNLIKYSMDEHYERKEDYKDKVIHVIAEHIFEYTREFNIADRHKCVVELKKRSLYIPNEYERKTIKYLLCIANEVADSFLKNGFTDKDL